MEVLFRTLRFCIAGSIAAAFYFCLLAGMVEWLKIPAWIATAIAYPLVTVENYFLHHAWTFKSTARHGSSFPKFIASAIAGFFLNWLIMYISVETLGINYLLAQAISITLLIGWNLVAGSLWIFNSQSGTTRNS